MSIKIRVDASGLDFDLASRTIKLTCPECKAVNTSTLGQVQREERITCVGCQKTIRLVDKDKSTAKAISDINRGFDELRRALEDLGR
jgi:transposase-like protein